MTCLEHHHLATGSAIGENELMDNAFEEAPSPSHHRRSAVALAPEQRSPPKAGFYASLSYLIYINKEELKTVGRDILACAQPNRHETFIAHWSPYRRVSSRGRRAQIRFGRGARGEKPENDRPPFWFYGESIRTFVFNINKEELKTVGRDILACAQPNRHESFTAHWSPYRRVSSRGRRAQIRFGRGARGEKPENDRPPFWFYGESIRTSVFNNTSQHNTSVHGLHGNGGNAEAADGAVAYDQECKAQEGLP